MSDLPIACTVDCLWAASATLGEGLIFDPGQQCLWFIDIKRPRLFRYGLKDASQRVWPLAAQVSALALPPPGWRAPVTSEAVLLCAGAQGFSWAAIDGDTVTLSPIADPEADVLGNRFNDGKAGPDGRFYAGTMDDAEQAATGALYALDHNGQIIQLDHGYRVTNGPAFSPDGLTLYHNDSALRRTYAFDLAPTGAVSRKRIFHEHDTSGGYPDGMTTDAKGNLYIAMWDGSRIQKLDASGNRAGFIPAPVRRPTNCVFTSPGVLAFTSASIGLETPSPLDGGLFCARL